MHEKQIIGNCTLYRGDCLEVMPELQAIDAVVTDPPYVLGKRMRGGTWGAKEHNQGFEVWDTQTRQDHINQILLLDVPTIIWGGNYYQLPPSRCWLLWNKINAVPTMADAEIAWTNFDKPAKRFDAPVGRVEFGHPTQKPLPLMKWCIDKLPKNAATVLDPFMGSATTGVACVQAGRKFIGIELDKTYFDIACSRIEQAVRDQSNIFPEVRASFERLEQTTFF